MTAYYDFSIPENELRQAAEQSHFECMKDVEKSQVFPYPWLRPRNNAPKVRRGIVGGYLDDLSDEDVRYLNSVFGKGDTL